jgi:hypothetical protein
MCRGCISSKGGHACRPMFADVQGVAPSMYGRSPALCAQCRVFNYEQQRRISDMRLMRMCIESQR